MTDLASSITFHQSPTMCLQKYNQQLANSTPNTYFLVHKKNCLSKNGSCQKVLQKYPGKNE